MASSRVALYGRYAFYRTILAPVRAALDSQVDAILTGDPAEVVAFRPHVLLVAAHDRLEYFRYHLPATQIGNVRHGMVSKAVLARTPRRPTARTYDFVCTGPDDTTTAVYRRAGATPGEIWRTGYPQLDPLHRRDPAPDLGLDPTRPTVLFAPTWNLGLSSAPILGARVVDLVREGAPGANVIIKPHPVVREWHPGWMRQWRDRASGDPGVLLVEDTHADVAAFMLAADLMVSDASSVIFEYLALDRPMVLVTNRHHRADPAFDPDDIIWGWRDVGAEVKGPEALPAAIAAELADPGRHAVARARYAAILFDGQADGRNAARIAARAADRSREIAARGAADGRPGAPKVLERRAAGPRIRAIPGAWLGRVRWTLGDLVRSVWQRPVLRRIVAGPLERRRLAARYRALLDGTLRGADGQLLTAAPTGVDRAG
jgi:hypothetical protein